MIGTPGQQAFTALRDNDKLAKSYAILQVSSPKVLFQMFFNNINTYASFIHSFFSIIFSE